MTEQTPLNPKTLEKKIASQIVDMMKSDGLAWVKRWRTPTPCQNGMTGHVYAGSNIFSTAIAMMAHGWTDPRFLTFKQLTSLGGSNKGAKGIPIIFYGTAKTRMSAADQAEEGQSRGYRFARLAYVFNVEQITGLDESKLVGISQPPAHNEGLDSFMEAWIERTGAKIRTGADRAAYNPGLDTIFMPDIADFLPSDQMTAQEGYYSTLLHEMIHWTGGKPRLNRIVATSRDSAEYAYEELVAEIGSVIAGVRLGVQTEPRPDNAYYVQSWIALLQRDPSKVFSAASEATRAYDYLSATQFQLEAAE